MFFNRNNVSIGIALGIIVPFLAYTVQFTLLSWFEKLHVASSDGMAINFKTRTVYMIALCSNALLVAFYQRRRASETVRGLTFVTIALAFIWFLYFGYEILEQ